MTTGLKPKPGPEETGAVFQAIERFEKELDKAYDLGDPTVTVRFVDAVTVLRAVNILLHVSHEQNEN